MGINLLDFVKNQLTTALVQKTAGLVGEKSADTQKALDVLLPSVLGGLANRATTLSGSDNLLDMINEGGHDGRVFDALGALLGGGVVTQGVLKIGEETIKTLFGSKTNGIVDWVANHAGIKTGSAISLLSLAAPLMMGAVGKQLDGKGSASSLISLLGGQLPHLQNVLPSGLLGQLGLLNLSVAAKDSAPKANPVLEEKQSTPQSRLKGTVSSFQPKAESKEQPKTPAKPEAKIAQEADAAKKAFLSEKSATTTSESTGGEKTLFQQLKPWLILLGAALFGLLCLRTCKSASSDNTPVAEAPKTEAQSPVNPAQSAPQTPVNANGEKVLKLASGDLTVKAGTFLDLLYTAVTDDKADLSKPLTFDNVNFPKNETSLTDNSKTQLNDLVKIMKAYPKFDIKINGYTDSRGDAGENKKLSSGRAASVKAYLSAHDIDDIRMKTEGFGAVNPVANNETEEGRVKNRRIEVVITKKL